MSDHKIPNLITLSCTFGSEPSSLVPSAKVEGSDVHYEANIMDHEANVNVQPFGLCCSMNNPEVIAATTATLGIEGPVSMPCKPITLGPWSPGDDTTLVGGKPALCSASMLACMWGGVIRR
ncbi:MAG: DUF4280 domain-containing protein [Deltaproteobacteria bacterium]|nr:MAG: DUF4280 domain-containing protein [Deltaproteobacteria bacterium]